MVWLRLGAPAVIASHSAVEMIKANFHVVPRDNVADMGLRAYKAFSIKVFYTVTESIELERDIRCDGQSVLLACEGKTADIGMVSVLLRADIRIIQIPDIGTVAADESAGLAVNIVLLRSSALPAGIGILRRNPETQADSRETRCTFRTCPEAAENPQSSGC